MTNGQLGIHWQLQVILSSILLPLPSQQFFLLQILPSTNIMFYLSSTLLLFSVSTIPIG